MVGVEMDELDSSAMSVDEAIETVARHIVHRAAHVPYASLEDMWEDFPEIGKSDWLAVIHRSGGIIERELARQEDLRVAYGLLADKDGDES